MTEETPRKHRPQVLLVGNGIDRLFNDNAWQSFLHKFADENYPVPEDILSVLPFPLQYEALTAHSNDDAKKEKLKKALSQLKYAPGKVTEETSSFLKRLTALKTDGILTTNFSFTLEEQLHKGFSVINKNKLKDFRRTYGQKNCDNKYLLYTCFAFNEDEKQQDQRRIWHIHGHIRNEQSVLLSHYTYSGVLRKMLTENYDISKGQREITSTGQFLVKSWLDLFLIADVYILGLSLSTDELDLWWLLERKKLGFDGSMIGSVTYYAPEPSTNGGTIVNACHNDVNVRIEINSRGSFEDYQKCRAKKFLLQTMGVKWESFGMADCGGGVDYLNFYNKAAEDIEGRINTNATHKSGIFDENMKIKTWKFDIKKDDGIGKKPKSK